MPGMVKACAVAWDDKDEAFGVELRHQFVDSRRHAQVLST